MTLAARAITSPELALLRTEGQWGKYYAAILAPTTVYTAQVNQTFPTTDKVIEVTYDNGSGTLGNVLEDMTMLIGSTAGARDLGICRVKSIDASKVYIGETSHINWANNLHLTILRDWSLWARHVRIVGTTPFMDGTIAYSDQHSNFDPIPIMGSHRVLKLTGATISTQFNWADSYVPGSTISSYLASSPGSSGSSGTTTSTPTFTYNAVGWYPVFATVTAANGKSSWGIRWVYVWSEASPPPSIEITEDFRQTAESGGWEFGIRLSENVDTSTVRERALVIVFGEEFYGTTQQSIGQVTGCENIISTGWIGGEEDIHWNPMQGSVSFKVYTAHYWLGNIPSFPDGVRFVTRTPAAWTEIQQLTLDKGLHHFLRWRTTAPRVMDVSLTGDTKLTAEVHSVALNLWEQLREIAFLQILARPGVDRLNRLFIQVHPQLIPTGSRPSTVVMAITEDDLAEEVEFKRITVQPNAFVDLSGVAVNSAGNGTPYFSISPGRAYPPYGTPEMLDHLLVESQSQSNTLAGLYRGWLNNELPDIPVKFIANNRMLDCFPFQKWSISIASGDTPRSVAYNINIFPKEVTLVLEKDSGYFHTEAIFEAETFPDIAVNGDVPGNENIDTSFPPLPPLPPLPPFPPIVPGTIEPTEDGGPPKVIGHDPNAGLLYTENFHETGANVDWLLVNAGLTQPQYQSLNEIVLNRLTGEIYVANLRGTGFGSDPFIAYAPSIGSTFTIIEDITTIAAKFSPTASIGQGVGGIGIDPLTGKVVYIINNDDGALNYESKIFIGSGTSFVEAQSISGYFHVTSVGNISFGNGHWRITGMMTSTTNTRFLTLDASAGSIVSNIDAGSLIGINITPHHVPISTTDAVFLFKDDGVIRVTQNGTVPADFTTIHGADLNYVDFWYKYFACDPTGMLAMTTWDTGMRGKSSDGGDSWTGLPGLPFGNEYAYDYAGGEGTESRWVAARAIIRYSPDFGTTWENKEGNLNLLIVFPSLDIIKVVEY